ncbi:MAG: hypothetical protein IK036_02555 [Clostridia bacterium]|nr:hypothetical protein [Clostridia bacterium]MBR5991613.1 hypothetical protein [Clostridia bacterium]
MEKYKYVSSDANVWFDFNAISKIDLPFRMPYKYIMYKEALRDEIISPPELLESLLDNGLKGVDITTEEFYYAAELGEKYVKLSVYDRIALSIAKNREIVLLTGDGALRKAAESENVSVLGTIGLLDELYENRLISTLVYRGCLRRLKDHNERRLPIDEIDKRLGLL